MQSLQAGACMRAPAVVQWRRLVCGGPQAQRRAAGRQLQAPSRPRRQACRAQAAAETVGTEPSVFQELASSPERKYIMISGKGGVGKTSLSASLAACFAQAGHTTLVVSTDPAHSLSDSLAQDVGGGVPVLVEGTDLPLWGMEIDIDKEKEKFRAYAAGSGKQAAKDVLGGFGLAGVVEQLAELKLGELLDTPPPGFDEAVAIAKVNQFVQNEEYARFTRIVFDTAPTGHTLRLLTVPDFVEASLTKIIRLRQKLSSASAAVRGLFGAAEDQAQAVGNLEKLQESIRMVKGLFRDQQATEFIIATIPTVLGINESARLARALRKENIPCKRIVVNQVLGDNMDRYLDMKLRDQQRAMEMIAADGGLHGLTTLEAPYLDLEVRGVPALQYFGSVVWAPVVDAFAAGRERKYFMLGGKGGVGKTSASASLGVRLGEHGHTTLIVSTDPAHSLSDSLDQDVSGGLPVMVEGTEERVYGMEIDIEQAREDLRKLAGKDEGRKLDEMLGSLGLGGVADQLKDLRLGELLDTPPPGIDEAVAIAKVLQFLKDPKYSRFTRIIFDTAPTGHTLRLLTLPDFLNTSVGKLLRLRQMVTGVADSVKGIFTGSTTKDPASANLDAFRDSMNEARDLFRDDEQTQFIIVTIPTIMAVLESIRLAKALKAEHVPVHTLVVNQMLLPGVTDTFLKTRQKDQQAALARLRDDPELARLQVLEAPLLDLEVRGVPALQYFGQRVWK